MILILSDEINLNPARDYNHHPPNLKERDIFKISGFHLLHVNINSLLPKIDELRYAAKLINAAVRGIIELKLDNKILDSEIQIDNYQILRCDRNKNMGGVSCYLRNDLSYIEKNTLPEEIGNISFEILLPKTKPIFDRILYQPPNQSNFLQYSQKRVIHSR